jgi:hypothetical protein
MSEREIRSYDYVNHPYEPVRDALKQNAASVLERATRLAEARGGEVLVALSVEVAGLQLGKDVELSVGEIHEEQRGSSAMSRVLHVPLSWQAAQAPGFFPVMRAEFLVYPLSSSETQIELHGYYAPPLGLVGSALDAVAGHRFAEASVQRFVHAVAEHLRQRLQSA